LLFLGFSADNIKLALNLSYIVFPAVIFLVIAGILTAVLNGFQKFAVASWAPALSSVAVFLAALFIRTKWAIYAVAFATSIGFLLQALVLVPAVKTLGVRYSLTVKIKDPVIAKLLRLGIPLFLYLAVANSTLFIERHFAAQLSAGAVSTLTYAMRLFTVPAILLATPLAVVAHPRLTRKALQDQDLLRADISETFRLVFFLFFPITVWIILNALPITRAVYERGLFSLQDSIVTSKVFALYGVGILPNAAAILLLRGFYVIADTITPLWTELIDLAVYCVAATLLTQRFGIAGLAIARGSTFYLVAAILAFVLWKYRGLLTLKSDFISFSIQVTVATLLMAVSSWAAYRAWGRWFESGTLIARLEILGANLLLSIVIFFTVARVLNVSEARNITGTFFAIFKRSRG
jgi:putative peptidoglycan lipid II flippase